MRHQHLDLEHVGLLVQPQFRREHAAMGRVHALVDLQAHDGREMAIPQFGLDHRQQVVRFFFVDFDDGIAGHPEQLAGQDLASREQQVKVVGNEVFELDEGVAVADAHEARRDILDQGTLTRA